MRRKRNIVDFVGREERQKREVRGKRNWWDWARERRDNKGLRKGNVKCSDIKAENVAEN